MKVKGQEIKYILFDLDETLYPEEMGLMATRNQRICDYMETRLGIDPSEVKRLRQEYYRQYGTTAQGLYLHHDLDMVDYQAYAHDVRVEDYLAPDPLLDGMLERMEAEKAIFTNSPMDYVRRVLRALGVERHFSHIFDIFFLEYITKPDKRAYLKVMEALRCEGRDCLLVDDLTRNLKPGKELGMMTVLVGNPGDDEAKEVVDFAIPRVIDLESIVDRP